MLPAPVAEALPRDATVLEVGVGGRFTLLEALHETRPDLQLVATDVRPAALEGAPEPVRTFVDDVWEPEVASYDAVDLIVSVRCPAEMQPPLARLASTVDARLALAPIKDEWAHLDRTLGPHQILQEDGTAWRIWPPLEGPQTPRVTEQES